MPHLTDMQEFTDLKDFIGENTDYYGDEEDMMENLEVYANAVYESGKTAYKYIQQSRDEAYNRGVEDGKKQAQQAQRPSMLPFDKNTQQKWDVVQSKLCTLSNKRDITSLDREFIIQLANDIVAYGGAKAELALLNSDLSAKLAEAFKNGREEGIKESSHKPAVDARAQEKWTEIRGKLKRLEDMIMMWTHDGISSHRQLLNDLESDIGDYGGIKVQQGFNQGREAGANLTDMFAKRHLACKILERKDIIHGLKKEFEEAFKDCQNKFIEKDSFIIERLEQFFFDMLIAAKFADGHNRTHCTGAWICLESLMTGAARFFANIYSDKVDNDFSAQLLEMFTKKLIECRNDDNVKIVKDRSDVNSDSTAHFPNCRCTLLPNRHGWYNIKEKQPDLGQKVKVTFDLDSKDGEKGGCYEDAVYLKDDNGCYWIYTFEPNHFHNGVKWRVNSSSIKGWKPIERPNISQADRMVWKKISVNLPPLNMEVEGRSTDDNSVVEFSTKFTLICAIDDDNKFSYMMKFKHGSTVKVSVCNIKYWRFI